MDSNNAFKCYRYNSKYVLPSLLKYSGWKYYVKYYVLHIMVNNMLDFMVNSNNIINICLAHWTYYTFTTQLFQAIISSKPKKVYF